MAIKLYQRVAQKIEQYILDNKLSTGDKLPSERVFSEMFDAGRNIVREALKLLSEKQIIEIRDRSGAYIRDGSSARIIESTKREFLSDTVNIDDILAVRRILEPKVIELCVRNITGEQFKKLCDLNRLLYENKNTVIFAKLHIEFHEIIAEATGNSVLHTMMCQLYNAIGEKVFRLPYSGSASEYDTLDEHEQLLDAIRCKNYKLAAEAIEKQIQGAERDVEYLRLLVRSTEDNTLHD